MYQGSLAQICNSAKDGELFTNVLNLSGFDSGSVTIKVLGNICSGRISVG